MTMQSLEVILTPLTAPPLVELNEQQSKPFECEGESLIDHYKGVTGIHSETWKDLHKIASDVKVIDPDIFRQRDERGLPTTMPFSLNGNGIATISVEGASRLEFSADFKPVLGYYGDVQGAMERLSEEKYNKDHPIDERTWSNLVQRADTEEHLDYWQKLSKAYDRLGTVSIIILICCFCSVLCFILSFFFPLLSTWSAFLFLVSSVLLLIACVRLSIPVGDDCRRERCQKYLAEVIKEKNKMVVMISQKLVGTIPPKERGLIREYQSKKYFDQIFILTESHCEVEHDVSPLPTGTHALIIGERQNDDRFFLISQFELLLPEQEAADVVS